MDNQSVLEYLSRSTDEPLDNIKILMKGFIKVMQESLEDEGQVIFPNFGTFESRIRQEKIAIHPATGKRLMVPPKVVVSFKPAQQLKNLIKDGR